MEQLPILNLSDWYAGGQRRNAFITKLADAARRIGFFYLTGHGLGLARQQQVLQLAADFFALPVADKLAVKMANTPHFRGYTRLQGELTLGKPDWREQFDIMQEEVANPQQSNGPIWWQLQGPNQWPSQLPQMKSTLLAWQQDLVDISVTLLRAFAVALEQPESAFDATIEAGPYQHMKLIRYPGADGQTSGQGVGAHKDPGYLTLVLQDKQSGLEVQTDNGWLSIPPLEDAFVVNIGELLELASNGYLKATNHRVTSPPAGVERYSCAFFMAAQLNATVPLLPLPKHLANQAQGPASDPLNPLFHQVGQNVLKGRLRSHPDVAQAHYASFAYAI
ncbi:MULTISPECIES: isopenicillin N synthase family dioxygenase [Shewanella]|uniref:2OG-Fe(II) oxygenase n=1 Tax=Shewanella putrefaciens (strain CN-32 / ATCC BAA-453) TaxID=319224 RepID=A4Y3C5_SHEPC|nr:MULTISPECIES: 2-oxoglutarate and iron-dependent oxygenase domain-containing protein [Shewanella]ABM26257.1 2OG-Fe(II) oxygenase [Shewanella sp. W3-18-1]QGS51071.1 isopenicillin N synthase family oxygenase [Shewanella putrefaciens]CAD6366555.1 2-oxoglutarate-dependent ethylene/succinate-forming enzyme [Shewanella hafniensis]